MELKYFRLGIDWIRFNISEKVPTDYFTLLFLNFPNSREGVPDLPFLGNIFRVKLVEKKQRLFLYFFFGADLVFCLEKILDMGVAKDMPYAFTFYGTYFYCKELDEILEQFILRFEQNLSTSRMDIAFDTNVPTQELWRNHTTRFHFKVPYLDNEKIPTFYLGKKKNCKKHFIRVYDKKSYVANHPEEWHLLPACLNEEIYTRIEVQIMTKTLKVMGITPKAILAYEQARKNGFLDTENILEVWFRSLCINKHTTMFNPLERINFRSDRKIIVSKFTGRSENIDMLRYPRTMLGYAKRLHFAGFDVRSYINDNLPPLGTGSNSPDLTDNHI